MSERFSKFIQCFLFSVQKFQEVGLKNQDELQNEPNVFQMERTKFVFPP